MNLFINLKNILKMMKLLLMAGLNLQMKLKKIFLKSMGQRFEELFITHPIFLQKMKKRYLTIKKSQRELKLWRI